MTEKERMRWIWEFVRRNQKYQNDYKIFKNRSEYIKKHGLKKFIHWWSEKQKEWLLPVLYNPKWKFKRFWQEYQKDKWDKSGREGFRINMFHIETPYIFCIDKDKGTYLVSNITFDPYPKEFKPKFLDPSEIVVLIDLNDGKQKILEKIDKLIKEEQGALKKHGYLPRARSSSKPESYYDEMLQVWDKAEELKKKGVKKGLWKKTAKACFPLLCTDEDSLKSSADRARKAYKECHDRIHRDFKKL